MSMGDSYERHRMDRSLDEIAAEMNTRGSNSAPFGQDYEERDYIGAPIKGGSYSSRRYAPYSSSGRGSYSERGRDRSRSPSSDARVFVANLSFSTTWQNLKDHMRKAGPVIKCDVFRDGSGNSRGMGLALYEDMEGAETALRILNNTELDGRKIFLRKDVPHRERETTGISSYKIKGKPPPNPAATVFVGNLDYAITWQKLKDVFKVAGRVVNVDILMDHAGKSKGLAEVQFEDPNDAISAIALFHGQMLMDRPMTVRMDSRAPYQPDPLQLKLSSLSSTPMMSSGSDLSYSRGGGGHRGDYGIEPKRHMPSQYSMVREVHSEPYSQRMVGEPIRDYRDSRRGYSPPPMSYGRRTEPSLSLHPSSMLEEDYRRGSDWGRRGGSGDSSRDRRGGGFRDSDRRGGGSEANRKLFVKNLNYGTSWQHLKDTFRAAGSVQHVDIMEGPDGRSKGCAVVWFDSPEAARKAIDMFNDFEVDGRRLEVRYDRMN